MLECLRLTHFVCMTFSGLALVDKEKFSIPPPSPQQKSTSRQYNSINSYLTKNTIPLQSTPIPRKSTSKPQNNNPSSPIRKRVPTSSVPKKPQEKVARGKPSVESKQQRKKLHLDDDDDNYLPSGMVNGHDTSMNSSRSVSRKRTGKSWVQQVNCSISIIICLTDLNLLFTHFFFILLI